MNQCQNYDADVKKEKALGCAQSRKGLERDKVMLGRQRGPPRTAVLAVTKSFVLQASDKITRNSQMLAMWAILKSLCKELGAAFFV